MERPEVVLTGAALFLLENFQRSKYVRALGAQGTRDTYPSPHVGTDTRFEVWRERAWRTGQCDNEVELRAVPFTVNGTEDGCMESIRTASSEQRRKSHINGCGSGRLSPAWPILSREQMDGTFPKSGVVLTIVRDS